MRNQCSFALKDIWRRPVLFSFFALQLIVALLFVSFLFEQLAFLSLYISNVDKVAAHNLTFFRPHSQTHSAISQEAQDSLKEIFDVNQSGYSLIESISLSGLSDIDIVVAVGAFAEVYSIDHIVSDSDQEIVVLIGNQVKSLDLGDTIDFGQTRTTSLEVNARLPAGAAYVKTGSVNSLDDSILILADMETMGNYYYKHYITDIVFNSVLVNPTRDELVNFVTTMQGNFVLNPVNLITYAQQRHKQLYNDSLIFLLFFLVTLGFVILGIIANILQLINRNIREYAIHLLHGATLQHLYSRLVIYVCLLVSPPLLISSYLLSVLRPVAPLSLSVLLLLILSFTFLIACVPIVKLSKTDVPSYLRSDD